MPRLRPIGTDPDEWLDSVSYRLLEHEPERATGLGVDTGEFAYLRGKLEDQSISGQREYAATLRWVVDQMTGLDESGLTDDQAKQGVATHSSGNHASCLSYAAMLRGIPMRFLPRFDVDEVIRQLPSVTVMMGVPTFYTRLIDTPGFNRDLCRQMRLFISGSAPLLAQTFEAFCAHAGHRILERYGMSEAGMIASNPLEGERVPGTVGFALPGVTLRICDAEHQTVATGETGVLQMRGPNVFKGYWQMPEKTASEFTDDGFFIAIEARDPQFSAEGTKGFLDEIGGDNIELVEDDGK